MGRTFLAGNDCMGEIMPVGLPSDTLQFFFFASFTAAQKLNMTAWGFCRSHILLRDKWLFSFVGYKNRKKYRPMPSPFLGSGIRQM